MSKMHKDYSKKVYSGSLRGKIKPTATRKSHLYNRGPYYQPGTGMGRYKSPFNKSLRQRISRFFKRLFSKTQIVHVRKNPTIRSARANVKPIASNRVTTRVHQRKGER